MRRGIPLISAMAMLSACGSTGTLDGSRLTAANTPPASSATIVRSLNGGLIGRAGLEGINRSDLEKALEAEYRALEHTPAGQSVTWRGGRPSVGGEVVPSQPYRVGSQDCRPYTHAVNSGSASRTIRGTACRNADGSWSPLT